MRDVLWDLLRELRGFDARNTFLVGTLALVVVWLYAGSPAAFRALAGDDGGAWAPIVYYHVNALVLLAVLPLAVLRRRFGERPAAFGLVLGDVRWGCRFVGASVVLLTPIVWLSSFDPAFQREYPLVPLAGRGVGTWIAWELVYLVYYVGWEIYFRGVLLFGLRGRFGTPGALAFETAISTLVHIGKPFGETFGAIPGGLLFGAAALRSRSIVWPLLAHWYMGALMDVCAVRHALGP